MLDTLNRRQFLATTTAGVALTASGGGRHWSRDVH